VNLIHQRRVGQNAKERAQSEHVGPHPARRLGLHLRDGNAPRIFVRTVFDHVTSRFQGEE
jgi:hypothetical protein